MSYDVIHRSRRTKGLFAQGDSDAAEEAIRRRTFDLVVLCATELDEMFQLILADKPTERARVLFAPNKDGLLSRRQLQTAASAARRAANTYKAGGRVLITCAAGRNRSGLVTALALHFVSGCGGAAAAEIVKARRQAPTGPALSNPIYDQFLRSVPPKDLDDPQAGTYLSQVG